jgi:hypothetical protein
MHHRNYETLYSGWDDSGKSPRPRGLPLLPGLVFPWRGRSRRGSVLLIIMMMATVLLVSLTAALPSIYQEAQREREEELIFRGNQYAHAVMLFRQKFQRFPSTVDELIETDGMRFLRKAYTDPMDPKGKWRFIHCNAAGVVLDSKTLKLNRSGIPGAGPGMGLNSFGGQSNLTQGGAPGMGLNSFGAQSNPTQGAAPGSGQNPSSPDSNQSQGTAQGNDQNPSSSDSNQSQGQEGSAFFGQKNGQMLGAFIVGVAPTSRKASIRVLNKHTHYDEWEFMGVDTGGLGMMPPGAGGVQPSTGQSGTIGGLPPAGQPGTPTPGQPPGLPPPMPPDQNAPQ